MATHTGTIDAEPPLLLRPTDVQRLLQVNRHDTYQLMHEIGPVLSTSRRLRIRRSDLEAWLANQVRTRENRDRASLPTAVEEAAVGAGAIHREL
ncbi:MAG: helix-turn-helix domain-containing protein [Chloroflexota bacterium]|nr:helix-turn-helix domain-containing protein [Chloroflexota bacterium]MDQ6898250.1 helix-turn-helix domain-containing protein [Candidatus Dormibacteraeota bacterium]